MTRDHPSANTPYAIPLQEDYIIALYNHFCACQLSQHDLAVHSAFLHSLQPVLACAGRAFGSR
jgi:hypothetical protein